MSLELMKSLMMNKLQAYNKENPENVCTRLYFKFNGEETYIEDFSLVIDKMSNELKKALATGQTIIGDLKDEYNSFIIEKVYDHEDDTLESGFVRKLREAFYTIKKLDDDYKERKLKWESVSSNINSKSNDELQIELLQQILAELKKQNQPQQVVEVAPNTYRVKE